MPTVGSAGRGTPSCRPAVPQLQSSSSPGLWETGHVFPCALGADTWGGYNTVCTAVSNADLSVWIETRGVSKNKTKKSRSTQQKNNSRMSLASLCQLDARAVVID